LLTDRPQFCTRICLPLPSIGHEQLVMRLQFQPMPLLKRAAPFDELKLDGFRALAIELVTKVIYRSSAKT